MANRLADAISPYLRSHSSNPVDWFAWGPEPFKEAARRDVPVLVSIGYSTCHWCHVMARESFSDPALAEYLNKNFVAIKVDREEHPDVDSTYLAAASAFTRSLGWPLNVFVTAEGKAFHAGTYFPPKPMSGHPSFRQLLEAITDAWATNRDEVLSSAGRVGEALAAAGSRADQAETLPGRQELDLAVTRLGAAEDTRFGGFGQAPKFPVAPALNFLLGSGEPGQTLAKRTLRAMGASPLRDPVEGGFFRYSTQVDWSEPHYERMLYDNALLLDAYTSAWQSDPAATGWAASVAEGIADFLIGTMQLPSGGFASAQDSESTVDGVRVEGGYYALDEEARARQSPPARDEKVLTGWNGMAIGALAHAGFAFNRQEWVDAARRAADHLVAHHIRADGTLVRASIGDRTSAATATGEDFGMLADALLQLAQFTGVSRYARVAKSLIDGALTEPGRSSPFGVPGGGDPVLTGQGLSLDADPSEGAYPSGLSAMARASHRAYLLTGELRYREAAEEAMRMNVKLALEQPASFGASLELMAQLAEEPQQLVIITGKAPERATGDQDLDRIVDLARNWRNGLLAVATAPESTEFAASGFNLFEGRVPVNGSTTAYLCRDFVCKLPVTDAAELQNLIEK